MLPIIEQLIYDVIETSHNQIEEQKEDDILDGKPSFKKTELMEVAQKHSINFCNSPDNPKLTHKLQVNEDSATVKSNQGDDELISDFTIPLLTLELLLSLLDLISDLLSGLSLLSEKRTFKWGIGSFFINWIPGMVGAVQMFANHRQNPKKLFYKDCCDVFGMCYSGSHCANSNSCLSPTQWTRAPPAVDKVAPK